MSEVIVLVLRILLALGLLGSLLAAAVIWYGLFQTKMEGTIPPPYTFKEILIFIVLVMGPVVMSGTFLYTFLALG